MNVLLTWSSYLAELTGSSHRCPYEFLLFLRKIDLVLIDAVNLQKVEKKRYKTEQSNKDCPCIEIIVTSAPFFMHNSKSAYTYDKDC